MTLRRTSDLPPDDIAWLRGFLSPRPLFRLYLEAALADLATGLNNRWVLIGERRAGCVLGIEFDSLNVFTAIGHLAEPELTTVLSPPEPCELHLESAHESVLAQHLARRLIASRQLRIYGRPTAGVTPDDEARRLTAAESARLQDFMRAHNPRTVISGWMQVLPFAAIEKEGEIIAAGGTIARAHDLALLGNFLTRPDRRGRGLARRLALHLTALLRDDGVQEVLLATTADNVGACRAYERAGFVVLETRRQLDLGPA
jgi:ribosomal protein S18 acetylase RimI-like enzyme